MEELVEGTVVPEGLLQLGADGAGEGGPVAKGNGDALAKDVDHLVGGGTSKKQRIEKKIHTH